MAYQYYNQEKHNAPPLLEGGYHGDTLGAMSVGGSLLWLSTVNVTAPDLVLSRHI